MQLTVHAFLTLDGIMQGPGGVDEDTTGGFERGGWLVPFADDDMGDIVDGWFAKAEAILLGRTTYSMMQAYWTQVTDPENVVATALNGLPKFSCFDHSAGSGVGQQHRPGRRHPRGHRRLKERPGGELQVHGSWQLVQALHEAGLIDEYRLLVFPVCIGQGKRLFPEDAASTGFTLVDFRTTSNGAVYSALAPAPFTAGDFGVEDG